jgi:hypothetical protein
MIGFIRMTLTSILALIVPERKATNGTDWLATNVLALIMGENTSF